jgi:hypothetical protein
MTNSADSLLAKLDDIRGLGHIGWWPLAPGWWGLLALVSVAAGAMYWRRRVYWRSWKGDAKRALELLDAQLTGGNRQEIAASLSTLLRRIAMQRYSRAECAGLWGQDWLRWLSAKDPRGFDWVAQGRLLVEVPYAPPGRNFSFKDIKRLISAAKRWVM